MHFLKKKQENERKFFYEKDAQNLHTERRGGGRIQPYSRKIYNSAHSSGDERGMIGTINLDYRSLVHHFENISKKRENAHPSAKVVKMRIFFSKYYDFSQNRNIFLTFLCYYRGVK